jgi:hypothetical protein
MKDHESESCLPNLPNTKFLSGDVTEPKGLEKNEKSLGLDNRNNEDLCDDEKMISIFSDFLVKRRKQFDEEKSILNKEIEDSKKQKLQLENDLKESKDENEKIKSTLHQTELDLSIIKSELMQLKSEKCEIETLLAKKNEENSCQNLTIIGLQERLNEQILNGKEIAKIYSKKPKSFFEKMYKKSNRVEEITEESDETTSTFLLMDN